MHECLCVDHIFFYTMCIILPCNSVVLWGTASNESCFSPWISYLNNNRIQVINKRPGGMGWRAVLLLRDLWVACVFIFSWFSLLQHYCLLTDLIRGLEQETFTLSWYSWMFFQFCNFCCFPCRNLAQNELSHIDVTTFAHLSTLQAL